MSTLPNSVAVTDASVSEGFASTHPSATTTDSVMPSAASVVVFISQPFFSLRGSSMRAYTTIEALAQAGYQVDVLAYGYGDEINLPGVTVYRCPKLPFVSAIPIGPSISKLFADVLLLGSAAKLMARKRYSILHGLEEGGIVAALYGALCGKPYVFDMHSLMSDQLRTNKLALFRNLSKLMARIERICLERASAIITVSDEITGYALSCAPQVPARTIHDAPLDSATEFDAELAERLRNQFTLYDKRVLLYTGNFEYYQGVELLIDSFAELRTLLSAQTWPKTRLLIVGGSADPSDPQRWALVERAQQLKIAEQIIFAGPQPQEAMGSFMALADCLISPRTVGGNTPLKVYSYMAAARPIVATRVSSHTQVLDDTCAFLSEPTPSEFAKQLAASISEDPEARRAQAELTENATLRLEANFTKTCFFRKLTDLYSRISVAAVLLLMFKVLILHLLMFDT